MPVQKTLVERRWWEVCRSRGSLYTLHWLLCQAGLALLLIRWLNLSLAPESSTDSDFVWSSLLYLVLD